MDLSTVAMDQEKEDAGVRVHITDAAGDPQFYDGDKAVTITVAGKYSKACREALFAQARAVRRRGGIPILPEEQARLSIELVASCILDWEGFSSSGEVCPMTKETAVRLLTLGPWIREQLEEAMFARGPRPFAA
jgi:hypothetical protein